MVDNTDPFWPQPDSELDIIKEDEITTIRREVEEALENESLTSAAGKIQDYLEDIKNVELNIAITGASGSGKSTFINAFRGLDDKAKDSAPTGVVETTMEVKDYPHPKHPNVKLWDLPGFGIPNFKPKDFLQKVEFNRYDFFIIISSERFRANDVLLAKEIQKIKKKFYFVRSKIDANMDAEKKRKKNFNQDETLERIRQNCIKGLEDQGLGCHKVFLISSFELHLYDFPDLEETMEKELPAHKRQTLLMSIPNLTLEINQRKKEALLSRVWRSALKSGLAATVPIPGLSFAAYVKFLTDEIHKYYHAFGLDDESLQNLAERMDITMAELKSVIKSPLLSEVKHDLILKMLTKAAGGGLMIAEYWASTIPVIGSMAAGALSFGTTHYMLKSCLNELSEDAKNVLMKPLKADNE
ncbi:interferon-inducible GTPase 5 isoform X3 [Esox lucius]|uniref:IRG-type G domain-containing protein n=1 Tax=Esox lucius TaxID=8010 RepID=A0AAY5LBD2_ESOLU|nr:interferon-inducible GTPase 5 isoform X3 [Esox lucius]